MSRRMKRKRNWVEKTFTISILISWWNPSNCFAPSNILIATYAPDAKIQHGRASCRQPQGTRLHATPNPINTFSPSKNCDSSLTDIEETSEPADKSRRFALQGIVLAAAATMQAAPAFAGKPEFDSATGSLYSPKSDMLSGGTAAARGVRLASTSEGIKLQPGQTLQTVYETRFLAYLTRFLLTFDPAAHSWWVNNVEGDTWDLENGAKSLSRTEIDAKFAEFAESVEIGLADYFVGPYGSYSSVSAMKAGLNAAVPAKSVKPDDPNGAFGRMILGKEGTKTVSRNYEQTAKEGILNLYALLKARYTSIEAKRQLAILFSLISNPMLQPTNEIRGILGEADNASVTKINLVKPFCQSELVSRTSARRGGGYSLTNPPTVTIDPPPALGANYKPARVKPIMQQTSRVLRIRVLDGGEGYTMAPEVKVQQGSRRQCVACAILDREGHVSSVLVLDSGYGYGKSLEPPKVTIAPPTKARRRDSDGILTRRAKAVAELEYELTSLEVLEKGNGYVATEAPIVHVSPPEEYPDWYLDTPELGILQTEYEPFRAEVAEMRFPSGKLAYSIGRVRLPVKLGLYRVQNYPLELLPSSARPEVNKAGYYTMPSLPPVPSSLSEKLSPRYRAVDPVFGPIGTVPATKAASELNPDEYGRLALSGAVCTVVVRTLLNPLELIKTKLQLENDDELMRFAKEKTIEPQDEKMPVRDKAHFSQDTVIKDVTQRENQATEKPSSIGTIDMAKSIIDLRGATALFQSADITFLASLAFGSFGFGATELFRRYFTGFFEGSGELGSELGLLLAAAVATILTSAVAAPFEFLRVRSMGLIESKKWTDVLEDFLEERAQSDGEAKEESQEAKILDDSSSKSESVSGSNEDDENDASSPFKNPKELLPLWGGFPATATRELAFAIPKFVAFDLISKGIIGVANSMSGAGAIPIQVGVGTTGLAISAFSGAIAGIAGAIVSHPADLVLTYTSASKKTSDEDSVETSNSSDWKEVVNELLSRDGGVANLFLGLPPRLTFFFLVIGLQFFLYDYVKNVLQVGSDDLSLVLDVFYAVRQGLIDMA